MMVFPHSEAPSTGQGRHPIPPVQHQQGEHKIDTLHLENGISFSNIEQLTSYRIIDQFLEFRTYIIDLFLFELQSKHKKYSKNSNQLNFLPFHVN